MNVPHDTGVNGRKDDGRAWFAFVMVMLLLSPLPVWFVSPPKVAVAVQPFALVTFSQSPL